MNYFTLIVRLNKGRGINTSSLVPLEYDNSTYHFITYATPALAGMTIRSKRIMDTHDCAVGGVACSFLNLENVHNWVHGHVAVPYVIQVIEILK